MSGALTVGNQFAPLGLVLICQWGTVDMKSKIASVATMQAFCL